MREAVCLVLSIPILVEAADSTSDSYGIRLACLADEDAQPDQQTVVVLGDWGSGDLSGWHWGLCHDPAEASIGDCADLAGSTFNNWCTDPRCSSVWCTPAVFWWLPMNYNSFLYQEIAVDDHSITQSVLLTPNPGISFPWEPPGAYNVPMLVIRYTLKAPSAALTFCDQIPVPEAQTTFFMDGWVKAETVVELTIPSGCGGAFIRGDSNQDGKVNVSDAVAIARVLFGQGQGGALLATCWDSGDANDDGRFNLADAVFILAMLFEGGFLSRVGLPQPYPFCGYDQTPDQWDRCEGFLCR